MAQSRLRYRNIEELPEKGLAGVADQHRAAVLFEGWDVAQDSQVMLQGLAEADAGIDNDSFRD